MNLLQLIGNFKLINFINIIKTNINNQNQKNKMKTQNKAKEKKSKSKQKETKCIILNVTLDEISFSRKKLKKFIINLILFFKKTPTKI